MNSPRVIHAEWVEHPQNHGRAFFDRIFTLCGRYVDAATEIDHVDKVSCPRCRAILTEREEISV